MLPYFKNLMIPERIDKTITNVKTSDLKEKKVLSVTYRPDLRYAWDNGLAIGRYLEGLKAGRILATCCHKCHRTVVPPRSFCELCWRPMDEWTEVKDTGVIATFAVSHVNWDASRVPEGTRYHTPAVINLDGGSADIGILHLIDEIEPYDIKTGMKVQAVWKPEDEREGSITDIKYFKPV